MKKFEPPVCEMILFGAGDVLTKSNLDGDSHGEGLDGVTDDVGQE